MIPIGLVTTFMWLIKTLTPLHLYTLSSLIILFWCKWTNSILIVSLKICFDESYLNKLAFEVSLFRKFSEQKKYYTSLVSDIKILRTLGHYYHRLVMVLYRQWEFKKVTHCYHKSNFYQYNNSIRVCLSGNGLNSGR